MADLFKLQDLATTIPSQRENDPTNKEENNDGDE